MPRRGDHLADRRHLHQAPRVHDAKPIDELRHQAQIVPNQNDRRTKRGLHLPECLHHLALHHHIERAGRFVSDDHLGTQADRNGDAGALFHAARELVRIFVGHLGRQPDLRQQRMHLRNQRAPRRQAAMILERIGNLVTNTHHRIERVHRPLRHHGNAGQPQSADRLVGQAGQRDVVQPDLAALDPPGRLDHAQDRQRHGRLAGAGLARQAQAFAGAQLEADVIDCAHCTARMAIGHA
jgi:hypothetical protein